MEKTYYTATNDLVGKFTNDFLGRYYSVPKDFYQPHQTWSTRKEERTIKFKNTNNEPMSLVQKFKDLKLDEPTKSFRKANLVREDGFLTQEGAEVFLAWLLAKFGTEFKTEVVDKLFPSTEKQLTE